jgi:hypothetical protein
MCATTRAHELSEESEEGSMDTWTIYPSINNHNRYALGSPDGRQLERGEAVEILLDDFRIPGFIEYSPNGDYFTSMTGQSICGLYAGMKVYLAHAEVAAPCGTQHQAALSGRLQALRVIRDVAASDLER